MKIFESCKDIDNGLSVSTQLVTGKLLLNCMDKDGTNSGYDLRLTKMVKEAVTSPVIASSGAGKVEHFLEIFEGTDADAALAAGIFHRKELPIAAAKEYLHEKGTRYGDYH